MISRSLIAIAMLAAVVLPFVPLRAEDGSNAGQSEAPTVQSPDENGRPFPSDRPGKADAPYTVEKWHFEIETDFVDATYDHWAASPVTTQSFLVADPRIKYGVTDNLDVELQLGGYQRIDFHDRSSGESGHAYGWNNDSVRMKYNYAGNDGSKFAGGFVAFMKLPDAEQSLRRSGFVNNSVEGGIETPMSYTLPGDVVVGFQTGVSAIRNADDLNYHPVFINIPSVQAAVPGVKKLTAALEFYSYVTPRKNVDDPNIYTLDPSLQYQLTDDIGLDAQVNFGLNKDAPDVEMDFGIAWVF